MKPATSSKLKTVLGWLCRAVVGGVFAFSGFVKAIDPWGTIYKIHDYVAAMGMPYMEGSIITATAFLLFTIEFLIGIFILTGCFRRTAVWGACAFMAVMLPLTAWIAIANPVSECGCFGDALIIDNWTTFAKNILLAAASIYLIGINKSLHWLITPALQWIAMIISAIYVIAISFAGYFIQPLIDFRPYPVGDSLTYTSENDAQQEESAIFIYEKNGVRKEFNINDTLPEEDQGWKFVGKRTEKKVSDAKSLVLYDDHDDDVTDSVLRKSGRQLILFMPSISDVSILSSWSVNSLYAYSRRHNADMIAVMASDTDEIEAWKDISMAEYPIYSADDTAIKTVVRGNPAVIYTENGKIIWKSTLSALNNDDFLSQTPSDPAKLAPPTGNALTILTRFYILALLLLVILSFIPKMKGLNKRQKS